MKTNINASNASGHRSPPTAPRRNVAAFISNLEPSSPHSPPTVVTAARVGSVIAPRSAGLAKTQAEASWENEGGALHLEGKAKGEAPRARGFRSAILAVPRTVIVLLGLAVVATLLALGMGSADGEFIAAVLLGLGMIALLLTIVAQRDRSDD